MRGTPVLGLLHFLDGEINPAQKAAIWKQLPETWGERFAANSLLASDRVPISVVNLLCTLAAQARGEDLVRFSERAGRFGASEGIRTVFKPLFHVFSMQNAIGMGTLMFGRVYDAGQMSVETTAKSAVIRLTGFPGDPSGCARLSGWMRFIAELSGARDFVVEHGTCTASGGEADVWFLRWE